MSHRLAFLSIVAVVSGLFSACADGPTAGQADAQTYGNGGGADRVETLVEGLPNAENLVFTSTGRLLVTSDDGIFEIVRDAGGYRSHPLHTGETCWFGGIVELAGTLYANCYDMPNTKSTLFAAPLSAAPEFRPIHELPGYQLANGLATDGKDLFVAATFQGQILRLQLSAADPLVVDEQEVLDVDAGGFANGIKVVEHTLYWSNFTLLARATLDRSGKPGRAEAVAAALTFFDDIHVDASGIWAADALGGLIRHFDFHGLEAGSSAAGSFDGPSAVAPAAGRLGLPQRALVVTERSGGRVSMFVP